jgi:CBS domain-containing protein
VRVRDLMTEGVVSVKPDASLREAASVLVEYRVSGLPVVDEVGEVVGVLSETDIVMKASGGREHSGYLSWFFDSDVTGDKVAAETVGQAMSSPALTITPDRTVHDAARLMVDERVNRLPVVRDGTLVGILTRSDIVRAFTRTDAELASEIEDDVLRRTFWAEPGSVAVAVSEGRVTLTGEVETETDREMLPLFVSRVPGVVAVRTDLRARTNVA